MEDMISRKALCEYALNQKDKSITPNDIMRFPSAQPETHEKRTETHSCDCISRQAAIDAFYKHPNIDWTTLDVLAKINALPSVQPKSANELAEKVQNAPNDDFISRKAAIDAVMEFMPSLTTPDGCGQFDREIFEAQEMFVDIGQALNELPSAQPEDVRCKDCKYNSNTCGNYVNCDIIPQMFGRTTDNFCSIAERRTDG